jgi:hypothetical protein
MKLKKEKSKAKRSSFLAITVFVIFIIALIVRFYNYPQNVYFAYDQARDSYFAREILKGDVRLIGPPSAASDKLFPGPLSLYLYSFVYAPFGPNPEVLSAFFRIYNALGVFLVFLIGKKLFSTKLGLLASFLYAISYEQFQYTLLMSHQPLAVLPILLTYMGLAIFIFEKRDKGFILTLLGLGLAIQFHYVYVLLIPIVVGILIVNKERIPKIKRGDVLKAFGVFLITIFTYIISEFKFGFRTISALTGGTGNLSVQPNAAFYALNRFLHDLILSNSKYSFAVLLIALFSFLYCLSISKLRTRGLFLLFWLIGGLLPYLFSGTSGYYYSAAASVSLILLISLLILNVPRKYLIPTMVFYLLILINNFQLIKISSEEGLNKDLVIQPGMFVESEKAALDYIYQSSNRRPFAVRALTIPLNVNTTWSYLFEWYGQKKYGYVPIWAEKPAEGFPGNLPYLTDRSKLPETQFVIIEPPVGIREHDKIKFFREENYFTKLIEEKSFGTIKVQKRVKF